MNHLPSEEKNNTNKYDYEKIANSPKFKQLIQQKKRFLIPLTIFFLLFYFMLPFLTSYSTILNKPAIGSITWTWIYAFAQFIMTWVLCMIYVKKALTFDSLAKEITEDNEWIGGPNQ